MRLLVVSSRYPPASQGDYELIGADTVTALAARHDIVVLTCAPRGGGDESAPTDLSPPRLTVRQELPRLAGRRSDSLRAPTAAIAAARSMRALIRELRPDLIFVWNATGIPHSTLWAAQRSGVPLAFYVAAPFLAGLYRDDPFARHLTRGGGGLRSVWATLMKLVNLSPELRIKPGAPLRASVAWASEAIRAQSPPPAFIELVQAGVIYPATPRDADFGAVRRSPPPRQPLLACLTRLGPRQQPEIAIRAFGMLVAQGIDARLEIAGPGEPGYLATLQALVDGVGAGDRVAFRGPLQHEDVLDLFERASALLVPSAGQDPLALAALQAAFARLPVVAAEGGGLPEALRPDVEALYFPAGDWESCAAALAETVRDSVATARRVSRARARARELSFDRYIKQIEEFLENSARRR